MAQDGETKWYWCLRHGAPEQGPGCRATDRLGPYDSAEEAAAWRDKVERRNKSWDEDDARWEGEGGSTS
jgi:hypothetical protein